MPRVSAEHLAARRRQILDAGLTCIIRDGFRHTSMQAVIKEADLSVGAVYRYFTSKHELVRAIAERTLQRLTATADELLLIEPTPQLTVVMDRILELIDRESEPETGTLRMAVQIWGEALHDPELAATVATVYGTLHGRYLTLVTRAHAAGQLAGDADPAGVAAVLFGMSLGYGVQRVLVGTVDRASYLAGITELLSPPTRSAVIPADRV